MLMTLNVFGKKILFEKTSQPQIYELQGVGSDVCFRDLVSGLFSLQY